MVLKMYSIYDRKQEIHHPPLLCHNTGHALRVFSDIFGTRGQVFNSHPDDFQIFEIGLFDDATAEVIKCNPHLIASGVDLMPKGAPDA